MHAAGRRDGTATLTSCTLSGNSASQGGAISTSGLNPLLILRGTTVSGNSATGFRGGGGLYLASTQAGGTSTCTIVDSTISGNSATLDGAGIYNGQQSDLSIYSSTITNNEADSDFDGSGQGGGIYNGGNSVPLRETILAGNWETAKLGSIYLAVNGECHGTLTTYGDNIVYPDVNCSVGTHYTQSDPKLADLADNGGLTMTHLPAADGAAVDMGAAGCVDEGSNPLAIDQRGVVRPIGAAYYLFAGGPLPLGRANVNGDSTIDVADVFYLVDYLYASGPAPQ